MTTASVTSDPPGANIWVDGVDTGRVTPARFTMPSNPGKDHEIRLILSGFEDQVEHIEDGKGLGWGTILKKEGTSRRELETLESLARNATLEECLMARKFVENRRAVAVTITRGVTLGLDPLTIVVSGDGTATAMIGNTFGKHEPAHVTVTVTEVEFSTVTTKLEETGFVGMSSSSRPGQPDEILLGITVSNGSGNEFKVQAWEGDHAPRFHSVFDVVKDLVSSKLAPTVRSDFGL